MYKLTPAMGWNSWNTFGHDINEKVVMETADAFIEKGLDKLGYEYIVIDDCWSLRERDENGRLVADPEKFPHGIKWLSDYVHAKGLKFGMYSCAGTLTCAGFPGSFEHEFIDAQTFAEWGVDLLKYDYCFHSNYVHGAVAYRRMGIALANCGRDILFSACSWGSDDTNKWIKETGAHMFRSTGDINDSFGSVKNLIKQEINNMAYNGQGCFNDLDMLIVGMNGKGNVGAGGCTEDEYMLHFAFWCMFGSPLMIGCDVRNMPESALKILSNKDLIRIDQDKAYRQPFRMKETHGYFEDIIILGRFLDDGKIAVGVFNMSDSDRDVWGAAFLTEELGIPESCGKTVEMRDVMTGEVIKATNGTGILNCKAHSCRVAIATVIDK